MLEDAKAVQDAGAFSLLLEGIPPEVGKLITENLKIPTLGIGAGPYCDGQVLIVNDMLGIFEVFTPKFVKKYANLAEEMRRAFREYISDIKNGRFPSEEHCYKMRAGEEERLKDMLKKVS